MASSRKSAMAAMANAALAQGFRVRETTKGWQVYARDGVTIVGLHKTPSDHRNQRNSKALLRKIGVEL